MSNSPQELIERYAACPIVNAEYVIGGNKYTVIRHFTGDRDINKVLSELAVTRANREAGLTNASQNA